MLRFAAGLLMGMLIGVASLLVATQSPLIEANAFEAKISAYVFPFAKTNLLVLEYPVDAEILAPLGCTFGNVDEDSVELLCGLEVGWNTYTLRAKNPMRYVQARAGVGRSWALNK